MVAFDKLTHYSFVNMLKLLKDIAELTKASGQNPLCPGHCTPWAKSWNVHLIQTPPHCKII